MSYRYRFLIESRYVGADIEEDVEYNHEPTEEELDKDWQAWRDENAPGSWFPIEDDDR